MNKIFKPNNKQQFNTSLLNLAVWSQTMVYIGCILLCMSLSTFAQKNKFKIIEGDTFYLYNAYHENMNTFLDIIKYVEPPADGQWITYYPQSKQIAYQFMIQNGQLNGDWKSYYKSGQPKLAGTYIAGNKESKWVSWHPNGQLHEEKIFKENALYTFKNYWKADGEQYIKEGNGGYKVTLDGDEYQLIFNDGKLVYQVKLTEVEENK